MCAPSLTVREGERERMRREVKGEKQIAEVEDEKKHNISKVPREHLEKHFINLLRRQDKLFFTSGQAT
jgi:hypothetical protein